MDRNYWIFGWILISLNTFAAGTTDVIYLAPFQTHSRLHVRVDESVAVEWKNSAHGFEIYLKGIGLNELGAPLGDEERWKKAYGRLNDARMDSLDFQETKGGVLITGKWKFPKGKLELADPSMEYFTFREKNPPRYVVDFWVKRGPSLLEVKDARHRAEQLAILKKTEENAKKRIARRLASEKARAAKAEEKRFCDKSISEDNNVFVEFQPVHSEIKFSKWLPTTTPDSQFHYFKPKSKDKDAQYVRLALKLYHEGDYGLAVRTLDFLEKEFPNSNYTLEMRFLRANAFLKLGLQEPGAAILRQLVSEEKNSPTALYSTMFLAAKDLEGGSRHQALTRFMWLILNYPNHGLSWFFHLGAAECLFALKETDRAAKEFRWVMDHARDPSVKAEAASRMGDLYLARFQYEQSLAIYYQALKYFPDQVTHLPEFRLNRGETLYQLGQFDRAKKVMEEFLNDFSAHPQGWRASFRLGEIADRQAADKTQRDLARKWYYETINRYPLSPGATLARIRLLPCGDHGGFDLIIAEKFFEESRDFEVGADVVLKNYQDMRALAHVRSLMEFGALDRTAATAIEELRVVKHPLVRKSLGGIANDYFQKTIIELLAAGKKFEALSYYTMQAPSVPPPDAKSDLEYLLRLSQAASEMGLGRFAKKLSDLYASNRARASSSEPGSQAPDPDDFEAIRKASEKSFAEAKALWILSRVSGSSAAGNASSGNGTSESQASSDSNSNNKETYDKIRALLKGVKDESEFAYERELILGLVDQAEDKFESALVHVNRAQLIGPSIRVELWLSRLQERTGDLELALNLLKNVEKKMVLEKKLNPKNSNPNKGFDRESVLGIAEIPSLQTILSDQARLHERQGQWGDVASAYERAIDYGINPGTVQYSYARALLRMNEFTAKNQANSILEKLANDKSTENGGFWGRMAGEALADAKRTENKK